MSPELESITSIGGIGGVLIYAAWQIRKLLASDSKQVTYDGSAQKWQEQQDARIERLEKKNDEKEILLREKEALVRAAEKALSESRIENRGLESANFDLSYKAIAQEKEIAAKDKEILDLTNQLRKYLP